jgi:hypothetical protein
VNWGVVNVHEFESGDEYEYEYKRGRGRYRSSRCVEVREEYDDQNKMGWAAAVVHVLISESVCQGNVIIS